MGALDTVEGLRMLLSEIAWLLRSQAAAVFGNVIAVIPVMLVLVLTMLLVLGVPVMNVAKAHTTMASLSIVGVTPLFAAFTGVLLWVASLSAGFADNWFALRRLRESLTHHRRLVRSLGAARAERVAVWLEHNISGLAGNISLAILLGMTPVFAQFFGLPLDVRHVTLSTASLTSAAAMLGWPILLSVQFWLAVAGIFAIGILNVSVAFGCSLALALQARDVPARVRRLVFRAMLRRFTASPQAFLFPERQDAASMPARPTVEPDAADEVNGPRH